MNVTLLGIGNWGCAIAKMLCDNGHKVIVWGRNREKLQQLRCNHKHLNLKTQSKANINFEDDFYQALDSSDIVVESVTIAGLLDVARKLRAKHINKSLVITSKGIDLATEGFPTQILESTFGQQTPFSTAVLTGPTLAKEILHNKPASAVVASKDLNFAKEVAILFRSEKFKVFIHSDILGSQIGGAFKNVIAIGCGLIDSMHDSANTKAYLLTRGLHEMRRLTLALGCMPQTITGLSGLGDLTATCFSADSRNFSLGKLIARGYSIADAQSEIKSIAEGARSCHAFTKLAKTKNIALPICNAIYNIIEKKGNVEDLVEIMMAESSEIEWI